MNQALIDKIKQMLIGLGLEKGDTVFVHSGIGPIANLLGPNACVAIPQALRAFHAALLETVGEGGTIATPGFFYDYARKGKPFILESSPPDRKLGFYPMHLLQQQECRRSLNPIASILAVGKYADEICAHTSAHAYGITSPWARLVERGAKGLVIGLPFMMTFIHHIEAMVGVPHIYNKIFNTPVLVGGKPTDLPVTAAVRYLKYDIGYKDDRIVALLRREGAMAEITDGKLTASLTGFRDLLRLVSAELAKNTSYTLKNPPKFIPGEVPDDGPRG